MSSWLEKVAAQHGTYKEEEEEEEDVPEKQVEQSSQQKQPSAHQDEEKSEISAESDIKIKESVHNKVECDYQGPNTKETAIYAKSMEKLLRKQENAYVTSLLKVRSSLTNALDVASRPLESANSTTKASKQSKEKYVNLRKTIMSIPIPQNSAKRD